MKVGENMCKFVKLVIGISICMSVYMCVHIWILARCSVSSMYDFSTVLIIVNTARNTNNQFYKFIYIFTEFHLRGDYLTTGTFLLSSCLRYFDFDSCYIVLRRTYFSYSTCLFLFLKFAFGWTVTFLKANDWILTILLA